MSPEAAQPLAILGVAATSSGSNSVVECQLPKLKVAGSTPVSRSIPTLNSPTCVTIHRLVDGGEVLVIELAVFDQSEGSAAAGLLFYSGDPGVHERPGVSRWCQGFMPPA